DHHTRRPNPGRQGNGQLVGTIDHQNRSLMDEMVHLAHDLLGRRHREWWELSPAGAATREETMQPELGAVQRHELSDAPCRLAVHDSHGPEANPEVAEVVQDQLSERVVPDSSDQLAVPAGPGQVAEDVADRATGCIRGVVRYRLPLAV